MNLKVCLIGICAAMAGSKSIAHAGVPAPVYYASASAYYNRLYESDVSPSYVDGQNLSASVDYSFSSVISNPNAPSYQVSGTSSSAPAFDANPSYDLDSTSAEAEMDYYYQASPNATSPVPVDITYELSVQSAASGPYSTATDATAAITDVIGYSYATGYNDEIDYNEEIQSGAYYGEPDVTQTVKETFSTILTPGLSNELDLFVEEDTEGGPSSSASATAFVDPKIYIDPAYLAAHPDVTLEISEGIGNIGPSSVSEPSAAPEPSVWLLLAVGVGLSGVAMRRGRRSPVLAVADVQL